MQKDQLEKIVVDGIASILGVYPDSINLENPLADNMDSLDMMELCIYLEDDAGVVVDYTLATASTGRALVENIWDSIAEKENG